MRYADLTSNRYEHDWDVVPAVYEGAQKHRGMDELVATVREGFSGPHGDAGGGSWAERRPSARRPAHQRDGADKGERGTSEE